MLTRLKKALLSVSVIVLFALYALQNRTQTPVQTSAVSVAVTTVTAVPPTDSPSKVVPRSSPGSDPNATSSSRSVPSSSPSSRGQSSDVPANAAYQDGTYTGSSANAEWGNVKVQAVIANGQISDVRFLEHPDHRSRSQSINAHAMPILTSEAISSQQAEVDIVTGATDTSDAFIQSLASALKQAAS